MSTLLCTRGDIGVEKTGVYLHAFFKADKLDLLLVSIKEDVGNGNCYCGRR